MEHQGERHARKEPSWQGQLQTPGWAARATIRVQLPPAAPAETSMTWCSGPQILHASGTPPSSVRLSRHQRGVKPRCGSALPQPGVWRRCPQIFQPTVAIPEQLSREKNGSWGAPRRARGTNTVDAMRSMLNGPSSASHNSWKSSHFRHTSSFGRPRPPLSLLQSASDTPFIAVGTNLSNNLKLVLDLQVKERHQQRVGLTRAAAVERSQYGLVFDGNPNLCTMQVVREPGTKLSQRMDQGEHSLLVDVLGHL